MLTLSTFTVVTSEMLPVGVLTPMAHGLGIASGTAGTSLTITGLVAAVVAAVVPRVSPRTDRRRLLAAAMGLIAVGNGVTVIAQGFTALVVARVLVGIGMGAVWGLAAAVAIRLVRPQNAALAVSFAVSGVATASVAGVPLATAIGNMMGWRAAFATLVILACILLPALALTLPALPGTRVTAGGSSSGPGRESLLRPAIVVGSTVIIFVVIAHFAAYTYVRPVLEQRAHLSGTAIASLLFLYGILGLAGNFAAGATAAHRPRATLATLGSGIALAALALYVVGSSAVGAALAIALWGLSYGGLSVAGQLLVSAAAPDRVEDVTGIYVGVFTASIAAGAFAGGLVSEAAGLGTLLVTAAVLAAVGTVLGMLPVARHRTVSTT